MILVPGNLAKLLMFAVLVRTAQSGLPPWFQGINATLGFILAAAGGYVAAILSRRRPVVHASVLAVVILLLAGLALLTAPFRRTPGLWSPWLFALGRFGLTVIGGFLAALQMKRRSTEIAAL